MLGPRVYKVKLLDGDFVWHRRLDHLCKCHVADEDAKGSKNSPNPTAALPITEDSILFPYPVQPTQTSDIVSTDSTQPINIEDHSVVHRRYPMRNRHPLERYS